MDSRRSTAAGLLLLAAAAWSAAAGAQGAATPADVGAADVNSADVDVEQQKLVDLRARLAALAQDQKKLEQLIGEKQTRLQQLRSAPGPEQAELDAARREVEEARAALESSPGGDSEARLKNAEFKLTLAQRKAGKESPETSALADEIDALRERRSSQQQQIASLDQQIETQASRAGQLQQRLAEERSKREQQARELARSRAEAEQAQQEIERLKALLAQRESEEKAPTPAPAVVSTPVAAAPAKAAAALAKATPATRAATSAASDSGPRRLTSQRDVLDALRTVEQHLAGADTRRSSRGVNEILHVKRLQNGREVDKSRVTLIALGASQFRGNEQLQPGQYELVLGLHHWPVTLAGGEGGDTVFLLDYSGDAPRLQFYRRSLEGG